MIERIHLEIIRAVEQHGTLTAASGKLHLTQSALSHSIRRLEEQLGVEIWRREGRTLRSTQAGQYLLALANRLIPQLEHAEERLRQFACGERGTLRIGIECHPCYRWLLKVVTPYLEAWPSVDLDVKQEFRFGGIGALFDHEIDLLVTPDPLYRTRLHFEPVFDYEQVLVVGPEHPLRKAKYVKPEQLLGDVLITYPVDIDRLDIFTRFLGPAGISPRMHKRVEATDIMLQMVASGRGVAAMPRWVVEEESSKFDIFPVRLGAKGVDKKLFLGVRESDRKIDYLRAFLDLARDYGEKPGKR